MFPGPPIIAFRRCKNLKDILVMARLSNRGKGAHILRDVPVAVKLVVKCVMSRVAVTVFSLKRSPEE